MNSMKLNSLLFFLLIPFFTFTIEASILPTEKSGWLGADGAYNTKLSSTKRLWIFGDTYIGKTLKGKRVEGRMIHNSIALETNGKFQYFLGPKENGFFKNSRKNEWYWPSDLIKTKGKVIIFLRRVIKIKDNDPLGFKEIGTDFAIIQNPDEIPTKWKYSFKSLGFEQLNIGISIAQSSDHIIFLADDRSSNHSLYLGRVPVDDLLRGTFKPSFYSKPSKSWEEKPTVPFFSIGSPEASLTYNSVNKKWRFIYTPKGYSENITLREATSITEQWSKPKAVFTCPEKKWNKNYFCYAAKEIKGTPQLTITYSVNSLDFWDLSRDLRIYIPRVIKL